MYGTAAVLLLNLALRHRAVTPLIGVPLAYRDLYATLAAQVAAADAPLIPLHPERFPQPIYATSLIAASCNRGEALLQPGAMAGVQAFLDALQRLGIRAVTLQIGYPLLVDRFPRSSEYLQFYRQVMAELRRRKMTVDIEAAVMFANSPFSPVQWDYSKMTLADLTRERRAMTATIISQLAPDYLNLGSEPDTEARLTTYMELNDPAVFAQHTAEILQGVDRGQTKVGTGIGTWNPGAFAEAEAALPIDFISLHIYPIDSASMGRAYQACNIARAHGKRILIDETWLYKALPGESSSIAADANIFERDAFSFFAPLDQKLLRFIDDFSRVEGVEFVAPFWSTYFFGYLNYTAATAGLSYSQIVQQVNAVAVQNIIQGNATSTGFEYAAIIAGQR